MVRHDRVHVISIHGDPATARSHTDPTMLTPECVSCVDGDQLNNNGKSHTDRSIFLLFLNCDSLVFKSSWQPINLYSN